MFLFLFFNLESGFRTLECVGMPKLLCTCPAEPFVCLVFIPKLPLRLEPHKVLGSRAYLCGGPEKKKSDFDTPLMHGRLYVSFCRPVQSTCITTHTGEIHICHVGTITRLGSSLVKWVRSNPAFLKTPPRVAFCSIGQDSVATRLDSFLVGRA